MMTRKQVTAASAEVDRIDAEITAQKHELERLNTSIAALNNRMCATAAGPADHAITAGEAGALLKDPSAPVSQSLISKLLGLRRQSAESASEQRVGRAAIRSAINLGREKRDAVEEQIRNLIAQRREAWVHFVEAGHSRLLSEMEAKLAEAAALAQTIYALQEGGDGRLSWHLEKDARVALKRRAPSISGKFEERELFPQLPRRHGRNEVKVLSGPATIAAFRESLRGDQPNIRRAA
jgi:hypothetical protein